MSLSPLSGSRRVATVSINFKALLHNVNCVRKLAPKSKIVAVIKANAYGHGLLEIAKHLSASSSGNDSESPVDALAVAMIAEAVELREAGITLPIMVLHGFLNVGDLALVEQYDLQPVIHQQWQLELLTKHFSKKLDVWIKIDTGMHRLGFSAALVANAMGSLTACENIGFCRLMSHYANSDEIDNELNIKQLNELVKVNANYNVELSMANSAAIITQPDSHLDWVRPGIMLYGASPLNAKTATDLGLEPVMQFESTLLAVNALKAGDCIGYGSTYTCAEDMNVGVVSVGYGDGYPRSAQNGTPVWINNQRCKLVGRVSMDSLCIDLRGVEAKPGDRVVLWGSELAVDEVALNAGTISYELLCSVGNAAGLK